MRKLTVLLSVVLIIASSQVFAEKRVVTVWTFSENNQNELSRKASNIENRFNIALDIKIVEPKNFVQDLQYAMLNNTGIPDIIEWIIEDNRILSADPDKSRVIPLDEYFNYSKVIKNIPAGRLCWLTYGNHTYGLPHDVHPLIFIYNDTLWKAAGVNVAKIKTYDEFFEAAKKLTSEQKNGKPVHYALPSGNTGLGDIMYMIWQQTGADILKKDGSPNLNSPEFTAYVKKWKDWYSTGVFTVWDWGNFGKLLKDGTVASYIAPDWWVSQVNDATINNSGRYQFKTRELPLYKSDGPVTSSWGGSFLAIPKGTKDPDFIYLVIEYIQYEKSFSLEWYQMTGMLPPDTSLYSDEIFHKPDPRFGGQKVGELQTTMAQVIPTIITGDIFWDLLNDFNRIYPDIINNRISIEEGLNKTQKLAMKRWEDLKLKK